MKLIPNLTPIDQKAIHELGIPSILLMEEAGRRVAIRVKRLAEAKAMRHPTVVIVCGKGNNGGDGFVCARRLAMLGDAEIIVVATAQAEELAGDALTNFNLLKHHAVTVVSSMNYEYLSDALNSADIVVDALFGSGLSRPIDGHYLDLVNAVNTCGAFVVGLDLPSGVHSETGKILGAAVHCDTTVTFAAPKPGLYLYPGKGYAGEVEVVDIGIPPILTEEDPSKIFLVTEPSVRQHLPTRPGLSHKYMYGTVLVIAGSKDMPGAAAMTAEATLKAGAGVVILACPASAFERMQLSPEIICLSLPETADGIIAPEAFDALSPVWAKATTVAVGPGMTHSPSATAFFERLVTYLSAQFAGGVVIDADGLNCLSLMATPPKLTSRFVLTPHLGECSRLINEDKDVIQNDLLTAALQTSQRYGATVILKSSSLVIYGEQRHWINPTGNPGMATAGSGDVLTGFVAGFLAQGLTPDRACRVAGYLHGLAGDKAADQLTQYSMTATDLITYLPQALKQVKG